MEPSNDSGALNALGSSAPEILLSIIEIVGNGFRSGELGPGTIVVQTEAHFFALQVYWYQME
ncbi:hypothetical protein ANCCAN_25280 [Ancylostoma caninum]|uniref:Uncharacterized protein n=1 Tax=Ancylostoma caninum TaxID=29170 RepID=A0A368FFN1_ANCCA|nr:hypothetical protein ANCCAN_25280 [Ancylostoma caninum]